MPRSPFHSRIERAIGLLLAIAIAGCGDEPCGPGDAPDGPVRVTGAQVEWEYGGLSSLAGNDCPDPAAPTGVISLSIEGQRIAGGPGRLTLCIPRPDLLTAGPRTLGTATSSADVRIIDLTATTSNCTFALNSSEAPTGTVTASGVCEAGDSPAGFALTIDATVKLRRTCSGASDDVSVTASGSVAVRRR
jgi:hypothetical protein